MQDSRHPENSLAFNPTGNKVLKSFYSLEVNYNRVCGLWTLYFYCFVFFVFGW